MLSAIARVTAGRTYWVWAQGEHDCGVAPATSEPGIRFTTNNTEPTTTSPLLAQHPIDHQVTGVRDLMHMKVLFVCTSICLHVERYAPRGSVHPAVYRVGRSCDHRVCESSCELVIEDAGLTVATSWTVY